MIAMFLLRPITFNFLSPAELLNLVSLYHQQFMQRILEDNFEIKEENVSDFPAKSKLYSYVNPNSLKRKSNECFELEKTKK